MGDSEEYTARIEQRARLAFWEVGGKSLSEL